MKTKIEKRPRMKEWQTLYPRSKVVCRSCKDSRTCSRCGGGGYNAIIEEWVTGCGYCQYTGQCPYCTHVDPGGHA